MSNFIIAVGHTASGSNGCGAVGKIDESKCTREICPQNGWKNIDNEWYIFDDNGYALQSTWYYDNSDWHWYYLNDSCKMVKGTKDKPLWLQIDSACYAFDERGAKKQERA